LVRANGKNVRSNTSNSLDYKPEMDYQIAHAKNYEKRSIFPVTKLK